jgi:hypothetical protein
MGSLPAYVSIVFVLTTFAAVAFLLHAIKGAGVNRLPSRILVFLLPLWLVLQGVLGVYGFYLNTDAAPPRIAMFGVWPAVLLIILFFIFFRQTFIERLPLRVLTLLHVVRIPVEIVLLWLFFGGQVPRMMTFEGLNFDILSGLLAVVVYFAAWRGGKERRGILIAFNVAGLLLLTNIVTIAILSLPSPIQQLNFDQPDRGVLYFPYVWLPSIVVPIVLFAHLASLWQLIARRGPRETLTSAGS